MGGVKNREEQRKRNNVFSSGGGGGTKGPAVVDKRNQELKCPHCDRAFKQMQRYREHLAKQHAEQEAQKQDAPVQSIQAEKVMDVGSKGGAWTRKSPKLLILEWTQSQKRPKPRFKVLPADNGQFGCKVVLPDAKDNQKDIVVFLDAMQAAPSEEAAQQAAALAALHHVAGDRSMHRILPESFLAAWEWLGDQGQRRRQQAAAREEREAARKEREKARRQAEARRKPAQVVMSSAQRQMVEAALKDLQLSQQLSSASPPAGPMLPVESAVERLQDLGFTAKDARDAVESVGDGQAASLSTALDWLCLHLEEHHLPLPFAAGSSGRSVEVIRRSAATDQAAASGLVKFGYRLEETSAALRASDGDPKAAFCHLFSRLTGKSTDAGRESQPLEEWQQEREALEAIYGEDAVYLSPDHLRLRLDDGRMSLEFRLPGDSSPYPATPPLLAIECADAPSWALLLATRKLAQEADALSGAPMVHELALLAPDLLRSAIASPPRGAHALPPWRSASEAVETSTSAAKSQSITHEVAQPHALHTRHSSRPSRFSATEESQRLLREANKEPGPKLRSQQAARRELPAFAKRQKILEEVQRQRVLIVSGATGCGKSTQVPQYILEEAIGKGRGGSCNIICTQPRRISAIGIAHRVSQERGEAAGQVVGYSVRFDTKSSARTRLLFCTTGILLRRLLSDPDLPEVSHVIVDEVHERSVDSDLLLLLLKRLLTRTADTDLKVILMSATADAEFFAGYFSREGLSAGMLSIPGFTFPVKEYFLEDAFEMTGLTVGKGSRWAKKGKAESSSGGLQLNGNAAARDRTRGFTEQPVDQEQSYCEQTQQSLVNVDESLINYDLLEALVAYMVGNMTPQLLSQDAKDAPPPINAAARAILIFMPGAPEINRLVKTLQRSQAVARAAPDVKLRVLPLHGALPPAQQAQVFEEAGACVQKIVVATNVAETSITIDDVVCVIDSGRVKETGYDSERGLSRLEEAWVSKAAAAQRRGRAGRVQPGICFKLFSRQQSARLQEHQPPEVLRVPLQQLCLTLKATFPQSPPILSTMSQLITPPEVEAVHSAVAGLKQMGALTKEEALTALGRHLAQMPMDAKLGKTLIYGAMLRCLSPVLTIVAAMDYGRPIFQSPVDRRQEAKAAKQKLTASGTASKSDHMAVVAAYNTWNHARLKDGWQEAAAVSSRLFLSEPAMAAILAGRSDYAAGLADLGFVSQDYLGRVGMEDVESVPGGLDEFSGNARIVKAALCAGFYPSLLRVEHPSARYAETHGGALEKDADPVKLRFFDRVKGRVFMHPGSVLFDVGRFESPWLVYTELTETSKVFCREASMVPIYALLLFGGEITVDHQLSLLKLDDWACFNAPARIAVLVKQLRAEIDKLLAQKVVDPSLPLVGRKAIDALHRLLATDGF